MAEGGALDRPQTGKAGDVTKVVEELREELAAARRAGHNWIRPVIVHALQ